MLRFISIGSGSSGNCYVLYTETDCLVIDCGVGIRLMKKHFHNYGLQMSIIRNIIITHDHADHVKSVGSLSGDYKIPVYATKLVHSGIEKNWCVRRKVDLAMVRYVEKGKTIEIGEFNVTPFEVPHDSTDCVGYYIESEGVSLTIVTDCGHVTEEIKNYISHTNFLIIEANHELEKLTVGPYPKFLKDRISGPNGHLSNADCARALVENANLDLNCVWLCHLSDENNHPELARKTIESILLDRGLIPGKDFGLEVLKRSTPSEIYELT